MQPLEGYSVEREGSHAVALELALDEELLREGQAREIVHAIQIARRNAGLAVEDRIVLWLQGDEPLLSVAAQHEAYLATETLALHVSHGEEPPEEGGAHIETVAVDGLSLQLALSRHPSA
jgi:isoleucyl-tRNA synthetase